MFRKHIQYLRYLVRHKWFVLQAGLVTRAPVWRLVIHDWTKFLPHEWFPYVENFYGAPKVGETVSWENNDFSSGRGVIYRVDHGWLVTSGGDIAPANLKTVRRDLVCESFDLAWLRHQHSNPHHWQFWVLRNDDGSVKSLPVPDVFLREMAADWLGAGRVITGKWSALEWYKDNKAKIILHPQSRQKIERLLEYAQTKLNKH